VSDEYPVRMVRVEGEAARAFQRAPQEFTTVTSAAQADTVLGDPGNTHHCPLCAGFFGAEAFKRHAPSCIEAYAPRWEKNRDLEPPHSKVKQYRARLYGSTRK
jgi:hypothetical protein